MNGSRPCSEGAVGSLIFTRRTLAATPFSTLPPTPDRYVAASAFAPDSSRVYSSRSALDTKHDQVSAMNRPPGIYVFALASILMLPLAGCRKSAAPGQAKVSPQQPARNDASPAPAVSEESLRQMKQVLNEQMKDEPGNLHYNLGNLALAAGKLEEAVAEYRQALSLNPKDADAHAKLGEVYARQDKTEAALSEFKEALKLSPQHAEANTQLGDLYRKLERPGEAVAAYTSALRAKPALPGVYFSLGNAYDKLHQTKEAAEAYRRAAEQDPKDADALYNLGNCYSQLRRFDDAIKAYRQAVSLKPDDAEAHLRLGVLYLEKKDRAAAEGELDKLKTLNPDYAEALRQKLAKQ